MKPCPFATGHIFLSKEKYYIDGTAEELAKDEQVRRLYLGRNFELKRKDYLHTDVIK